MLLIALLASVLPLVHCYSLGAPARACGTMTPLHRQDGAVVTPQTSDRGPPFRLDVYSNTYKPGENVTLMLRSTEAGVRFRGFIISARSIECKDPGREMDVPVGMFYVPRFSNIKTLSCGGDLPSYYNNTVTHTSGEEKWAVTFQWYNYWGGDVHFRYTVVQNYNTIWTNISTAPLFDKYTSSDYQCAGPQAFGYLPSTTTKTHPTTTYYWHGRTTDKWPTRSGAAKHEMAVIALVVSVISLFL